MPTDFTEKTKELSRNPLGIMALFITLAYSMAGLVVVGAGHNGLFWEKTNHPVVLFLAWFPLAVFAGFVLILWRKHYAFYAPTDFKDQSQFRHLAQLFGGVSIPEEVQRAAQTGVSTVSEPLNRSGGSGVVTIREDYSKELNFGFCLLHSAQLIRARSESQLGLYTVRVWIEAIEPDKHRVSEIDSVTYHLWPGGFKKDVVVTDDSPRDFELWLTIYGEFPVMSMIRLKDGSEHCLSRMLDLPGRPPD